MALIATLCRGVARKRQMKVVADVTRYAERRRVSPGQREIRQIMIERRRLKCSRRMTLLAISREPAEHVIGVLGAIVILLMAALTLRRHAFE